MLKLKSLQHLFSKISKNIKTLKQNVPSYLERNNQSIKQIQAQEDPITPLSISLKSTIIFVPTLLLYPLSFTVPLQFQQSISAIISGSILLPAFVTTYLNIKHPFGKQQHNKFYKGWVGIYSLSSIVMPFSLYSYPFIMNGGLILINLISTLIEYQLRVQTNKTGETNDEIYTVQGQYIQPNQQNDKLNPILSNKNYMLLFIYRYGVIALFFLNLLLDIKNIQVRQQIKKRQLQNQKSVEQVLRQNSIDLDKLIIKTQ